MSTRYPQTILVSCEIPWDEQGVLLEECFRREIRALLTQGFNHLYIFGTAGEGYAVTLDQYRQIVQVFWEETHKEEVFPMVGVIAMSTPQVLERVRFAFDLGVRAFQISLPPWGALDDAEYQAFFRQVTFFAGCLVRDVLGNEFVETGDNADMRFLDIDVEHA